MEKVEFFRQRMAGGLGFMLAIFVVIISMGGLIALPIENFSDWIVKTITPGFEELSRRDQRGVLKAKSWFGDASQDFFNNSAIQVGIPVLLSFLVMSLATRAPNRILAFVYSIAGVVALVTFGAWLEYIYTRDNSLLPVRQLSHFVFLPIAIGLVFFFTFRHFGGFIVYFALFWLMYYFFRGYIPDGIPIIGNSKDIPFDQAYGTLIDNMWLNQGGIYGRAMVTVSSNVLIFIVFGAVLMASGAGSLLMKVANRLTGGFVGGAAHAAVASSAIFGTISGAAISNVVSTGVMTIPVIKRSGFRASFAGAVEAAASTGGQVVPPVMGVVAFFVAAETGVPYGLILLAAIAPAIFYYMGVFLTVYFEARKTGIGPLPKSQIENLSPREWLQCLVFILPLGVLTFLLLTTPSIPLAGFWGFVTAFITALVLFPEFRSWSKLYEAFATAGRMAALILIIVAMIGIIITLLESSTFVNRLAVFITETAGDAPLFFVLVVIAIGAIILGMGLPPGATYFIIVIALSSGIKAAELPVLSLHLFVVFFAVMSTVTPPVALAAFAAAPIAGASPVRTGFQASRLAVAGFIIPFVFAFHPALIYKILTLYEWVKGEPISVSAIPDVAAIPWINFGWILIALTLSLWLLTSALIGFEKNRLALWERGLRVVAGIALLVPQLQISLPAMGVAIALIIGHRFLGGEPPKFHRQGTPDIHTA